MFLTFAKKPAVIAVMVAVFLAVGGYLYFSGGDDGAFQTARAQRGDLAQIVSVTGRVKPAESVNLAFEKGGRISSVNAGVGDEVFRRQVLVQLENEDLQAQLKGEEAKLDELTAGTRPEDIKVQETKVANAEIALTDAQTGLDDSLRNAFTKADDAIRNKTDQFISNSKSSNPQINFSVFDDQLKRDIESERVAIEQVLAGWGLSDAKTRLNQIRSFLDKVSLAVNALSPSGTLTQTTVDSYRADILTARTNINGAISDLNTAEEGTRSAESALNLAKEELSKLLSGSRPEQVRAQEASVENLRAQVAKTLIRAPISGVVTIQNAKIGEIAGANSLMTALISESNFEIEVNIPEADVAKVSLGDEADITLDAYGSAAVFRAAISAIDPAETIIEGVATYKTTLQFIERDERIKSGMTANADIVTQKLEGVIFIPQRAVVSKDGERFVRVFSAQGESASGGKEGKIKEIAVRTGIFAEGNIEILEGISEGDEVITFISENALQSFGSDFGGHF